MTTAQTASPGQQATKRVTLIDADVHHAPDHKEIVKRMSPAMRKRGWVSAGNIGFSNPHGVLRPDAVPPSGGTPGSDPDYLLAHHFEPFGVDYGILHPGSTLGIGIVADYRWAAAAATAYNDYMLETWLAHSDRFLGALVISPLWPEEAAKEIRRVGCNPRFRQVIMSSGAQGLYGHVRYWPIYEAAEEMGLPVAVHPGTEGRGTTGAPTASGWPSSYFEWHCHLPQNYMAHINSLVLEGVFQQFPKLTFVAVEGGFAWLPHLMWRLDKNWKALRETTPWLTEPPSQIIRRHVRLTTQPIEEPEKPQHLLQILEMMHAQETLMFSSDYPHWDGDSPTHAFPKLPQDLADRIFCKNAQELYRLPQERPL